ncbi:MAG: hypothetical protein DRO93_03975 [Candidatus Thorarchaeota archaeon]|nr:MAG: hypothetical protein DRO93_03975 [Candidatus Thorarchaeota archaeon]
MSEEKRVVIDLEETEETTIGELSEQLNAQASGVLSVKNISDRCRIWNVRVLLADSRERTNIEDETLNAGEIEAGGEWSHEYTIDIDAPLLTVEETFDTCRSVDVEEPHWAYAHGKDNPVRITIRLKNETDGEIDNIILNKTIPPQLTDVAIESVQSGTAEFDEGTKQVVWKDFVIYPHEESKIVITATATVEDIEVVNGGEVTVTYRAEGQQRSTLDPDLTALTEFLTGVDTAETEPNHWECTLECSNESDLVVRIDKAEVYLTPEDGGEKVKMIDESPAVELKPGESWSASFEVDSKTPPKVTHEVIYTPTRVVTKRVLGTVEKIPQSIPVYKIEYSKEFDPPEVNSFDKTPVEVTIEVKNAGTARLNEVTVVDHLPDDVMPPKKEHITIWIAGEEYTGDYEFTIEPDDQNPEVPHTLTFKFTNLKDGVGELHPGQSIKINYAIMAWKSRPEKEYPSPIRCEANIHPAGTVIDVASPEDGHKLGIVYKKRRISAKKAINRGSEPSEYVVMLVVENRGEVTVENVTVVDWIPPGFEYVSIEPSDDAPRLDSVEDGTTMTWVWPRMNPGDKKKLNVTVRGEGEYERREPEVTSD